MKGGVSVGFGLIMIFITWDAFHRIFRHQVARLSHVKLKQLNKELRMAAKERFISSRPPRSELVERGFSDEELERFLNAVDDPECRAAFTLMAFLGLRVGELCALRGHHLSENLLTIPTLKGGYAAQIRLPEQILSLIPAREPEEKLFHGTCAMVRKHFRRYREKAGLNDVYLLTLPCGRAKSRNRRFRLSLHSLRHYGIQKFYEASGKDIVSTRAFARHRHIETTEHYLKKEMRETVEQALVEIARKRVMAA